MPVCYGIKPKKVFRFFLLADGGFFLMSLVFGNVPSVPDSADGGSFFEPGIEIPGYNICRHYVTGIFLRFSIFDEMSFWTASILLFCVK